MSEELLPCPFCRSADIGLAKKFVFCRACGAEAGFGDGSPNIAAWNSRAGHLEVQAGTVDHDAPETFWMIELNDGSGWLASTRGRTDSNAANCLRFDSVEDANAARNRLPQSHWLKFKTSPTEHKWIEQVGVSALPVLGVGR